MYHVSQFGNGGTCPLSCRYRVSEMGERLRSVIQWAPRRPEIQMLINGNVAVRSDDKEFIKNGYKE
jgi:hypothetical protein